MKQSNKNQGKKLAVAGALIGLVAAGLKSRQPVNFTAAPPWGPLKLTGKEWLRVAADVKNSFGKKKLPTLAAGVGYYATLALFPTLAAAVAISALLITEEQLNFVVSTAESYLPDNISGVVVAQVENLVSRRSDNFLAAIVAVALAVVSASGASKNLVIASNAAYEVEESRGWLSQQMWGVIWTAAGIVFGFLCMALLAINQGLLEYFGFPSFLIPSLLNGRWIALLLISIAGLTVFYRYGPNRQKVPWQWVGWGATIATLAWMVATFLFFLYVQNFANFSQSYSLFAGIVVFMIWMNFSALIVLLGAEVNHKLEAAGQQKWGDRLRSGL